MMIPFAPVGTDPSAAALDAAEAAAFEAVRALFGAAADPRLIAAIALADDSSTDAGDLLAAAFRAKEISTTEGLPWAVYQLTMAVWWRRYSLWLVEEHLLLDARKARQTAISASRFAYKFASGKWDRRAS